MTFKTLFSRKTTNSAAEKTEAEIMQIEKQSAIELARGYDLIKKYPRSVSILGSARFTPESPYYQQAYSLAKRIATELGYAVVTGGGPGIMEAANKGAKEGGSPSIGFTIHLPDEQGTNKYVTESADFEYFYDRKQLIFFAAETYVYFPGGFGTLDELFSLVTSIQTRKITSTPLILVGSDFWKPIFAAIEPEVLKRKTINPEDTSIYKIVDSEDEILDIIKKAPQRDIN